MANIAILMLTSIFMSATAARCPEGFLFWYKDGQQGKPSCYKFVRTELSWMQSRKNCQKLGGDLVIIEASGENNHLTSIIKRDPSLEEPATYDRHWGYWTGGNDLWREGDWRWVANNEKLSYKGWHPGEPNNNWGGIEHCLHLYRYTGYRWNDTYCHLDVQGSICEIRGE